MLTKQNGVIAVAIGFVGTILGFLLGDKSLEHPLVLVGGALLITGVAVTSGYAQRWPEVGIWLTGIGGVMLAIGLVSSRAVYYLIGAVLTTLGAVLWMDFRNRTEVVELKQYGQGMLFVGLLIVVAFLRFGGDPVHNGIFWVGIVSLLLGLVVNFTQVATWFAVGLRLMGVGLVPLAVGFFMSTSAFVVAVCALITAGALLWVNRGQIKVKPA